MWTMLFKWERQGGLEKINTGMATKSESVRMHFSAQPASPVVALNSQLISTSIEPHTQPQQLMLAFLVQLELAR